MQGDLARRKAEPSLTFAHRSSDSRTFLAARSLKITQNNGTYFTTFSKIVKLHIAFSTKNKTLTKIIPEVSSYRIMSNIHFNIKFLFCCKTIQQSVLCKHDGELI